MTEQWRSRIVGQGEVDPRTLQANARNPRRHPLAQLVALSDSLAQIGWVQDVIVNRTTGLLVDGHARVEQAIAAGQKTVPVKYVELTEGEELLMLASFDPIAALADIDQQAADQLMDRVREAKQTVTPTIVHFLAAVEHRLAKPDHLVQGESDYVVLVECKTEDEQVGLLQELLDDGIKCRALVS